MLLLVIVLLVLNGSLVLMLIMMAAAAVALVCSIGWGFIVIYTEVPVAALFAVAAHGVVKSAKTRRGGHQQSMPQSKMERMELEAIERRQTLDIFGGNW